MKSAIILSSSLAIIGVLRNYSIVRRFSGLTVSNELTKFLKSDEKWPGISNILPSEALIESSKAP